MLYSGLFGVLAISPDGAQAQDRTANLLERRTLPINCTVKPLHQVKVSVTIPGVVAEVLVKPGQIVKAGDTLVRLDADLTRADLALAEQKAAFDAPLHAAQAQAEALSERVRRLARALKSKAISVADFEDAEMQLAQANANVAREKQILALAKFEANRARILVEKSDVRSPVDGVVGEDLVNTSESITNQPVATIYVTQMLRAEAFVPVSRSHHLRAEKPFKLIVNGRELPPDTTQLDYFSPTVNLSSDTISVYFTIRDSEIIPGHRCLLEF